MTRILDITSGQYIKFVPRDYGTEYADYLTENIEDSFRYNILNKNIEALISYMLADNGDNSLYPYQNSYTRQSFEIIYD
jgi:hypothetical protein